MKTPFILCLALTGASPAESPPPRTGPGALPEQAGKPAVRALGAAEFIALRNASGNGAGFSEPLPPREESYDLKALSVFVEHGENAMILPKGSILWCPEPLRSRLVPSPSAKCVPWTEFVARNRNWISTFEVTIDQASGENPLPETAADRFQKGTLLVIATYQGNPITVIQSPPAVESKEAPAP